MSLLIDFWCKLNGTVHPDDAAIFNDYAGAHGFNLDYPPPAFWGDVRNAPILILDNNGGFSPKETPCEYSEEGATERHLEYLADPKPISLDRLPPYYRRLNFAKWLESGHAALVNGVAYRSVNSASHNVEKISRKLPSRQKHRDWLIAEALPEAKEGNRLLIFHRWTRWGFKKCEIESDNVVWSPAPVMPSLTKKELDECEKFLRTRSL